MIPYNDTCEECLEEMFKRVGESYPNPKLTQQEKWFQKHTWSKQEQEDFRQWMTKLLRKRYKWSKHHTEWETGMFLLDWGWKVQ